MYKYDKLMGHASVAHTHTCNVGKAREQDGGSNQSIIIKM